MMGGPARRGTRHRRRARVRPPLQHGDHARGGLQRQDREPEAADVRDLRGLHGHRREAGRPAAPMPDLRRPRPRPRAAGFLRHRADVPDLRRPRRDDRQPLHRLQRLGPRDARARALRQHSGRCGGRYAHPALGRGRSGRARRSLGRPLHLRLDQAPSVLPARRRGPVLPGADLDGAGGARRRGHGAHDRRRRGAR